MALHKPWIAGLVEKGLARFEKAEITISAKTSPTGKDEAIPFTDGGKVVFALETPEQARELFEIAEANKGTQTVKVDGKEVEVPAENPINVLLTYAYGLNCRAKIRADFESAHEDPEKANVKLAKALVSSGKIKPRKGEDEAKTMARALAYAKALGEADEDDDEA